MHTIPRLINLKRNPSAPSSPTPSATGPGLRPDVHLAFVQTLRGLHLWLSIGPLAPVPRPRVPDLRSLPSQDLNWAHDGRLPLVKLYSLRPPFEIRIHASQGYWGSHSRHVDRALNWAHDGSFLTQSDCPRAARMGVAGTGPGRSLVDLDAPVGVDWYFRGLGFFL